MVASGFRWQRVHLFFVDERCVPPNDIESNYRLANENLITPAHIPAGPGASHPRGDQTGDRRATVRGRHPQLLRPGRRRDAAFRCGAVRHGAGCAHRQPLSGRAAIDDREHIAGAVYVQKIGKWRVTLLPGALLAANNTVFLVTGADKAPGVGDVFHQEFDPKHYPAQLISRQGKRVTWFLDQAAAAELA